MSQYQIIFTKILLSANQICIILIYLFQFDSKPTNNQSDMATPSCKSCDKIIETSAVICLICMDHYHIRCWPENSSQISGKIYCKQCTLKQYNDVTVVASLGLTIAKQHQIAMDVDDQNETRGAVEDRKPQDSDLESWSDFED